MDPGSNGKEVGLTVERLATTGVDATGRSPPAFCAPNAVVAGGAKKCRLALSELDLPASWLKLSKGPASNA